MGNALCVVRTVLVVDDDDLLLSAYRRCMERTYTVLVAKTAAEALAIAAKRRPDVAIVDLHLGSESGIDLIRALKRAHPQLFAVLISGYASVDIAVTAMRAGADDVLPKPVTSAEILKRVGDPRVEPREIETPTLARAQWEHVHRVLSDCDGNVSMAARRLGMYRSTLQRWLRRHAPRARASMS